MKRFESPKIMDYLSDMDVFKIEWLNKSYNSKYKNAIVKRYRKVIADIICWLFNEIIIPIIRYNFYCTEKH